MHIFKVYQKNGFEDDEFTEETLLYAEELKKMKKAAWEVAKKDREDSAVWWKWKAISDVYDTQNVGTIALDSAHEKQKLLPYFSNIDRLNTAAGGNAKLKIESGAEIGIGARDLS